MCRLYGFRATHPTRVECELIEAQNSMIRQSRADSRGLVNDDGWGIGYIEDGRLTCRREVGPASGSADYRRDAARIRSTTVLAHVRRATLGGPSLENTHPFRHDDGMLIHNGHVGGFQELRGRFLEAMCDENRRAIRGSTDSEHVFQLLMSRRSERPDATLTALLRDTVADVVEWSHQVAPGAEVALNLLWVAGGELAGSRLGRSLWSLERTEPHRCGECGRLHPDPDLLPAGEEYRAVVLASERITDEEWRRVPEPSVFRVTGETSLEIQPMENEPLQS